MKQFEITNTIVLKDIPKDLILFNSRFESGNLKEVTKLGPSTYKLDLNWDTNNETTTQWYYFSVRNLSKG